MRLIAGPCQHESLEQSLEIAREGVRVAEKYDLDYYFKASFDKANRTRMDSGRGRGLSKTLLDFEIMKEEIPGLKILTDIHKCSHVDAMMPYADVVDVLQIPAFLCRQTDLIRAAVDTGKIVNIKKGQFLAPWDVEGILTKTEGAKEVWITERGTCFGYNNLVVDFCGIRYMLDNFDVPIVFDATHSVQKPNGNNGTSGGNREYVPYLANAAAAIGVNDFFFEVHPDPDNSPSDGPNMLYLHHLEEVVSGIKCHSNPR